MEVDEIRSALEELAHELDRRGVNARILLAGGVVMALAFGARIATADVDADVHPVDEVLTVARLIGGSRGLPDSWLSPAAKTFIPTFKEPDWRPVFTVGRVQLLHADERAMPAMKRRAGRGQRHQADITFLCRACRITSAADAVDRYRAHFPDDPLPDRAGPLFGVALDGG